MNSSQPNLLWVFADQLRYDGVGSSGNRDVRTPHLDAFAASGVRATRVFANAPVCGPCRASMLTGVHPTTHGVIANDLAIRTDLPTLGTAARDAGYRTGYIGKWHLDGVPRRKFTPPGERRLGFDDFWAVWNCAHDYFNTRYFRDDEMVHHTDRYEPVVQTDLAIEFLRGQRDDAPPFCLALSWGPPHDPYPQVPVNYRAAYDPAAISLRPNAQPDADNVLATGRNLECRRTIADYYAAMTALDDQFARLLAALDELGLRENTIVVFTSDHGDMLWAHGWMKKQTPFEESVHVPFFAAGPGLPHGATCDATIGLVDLMPTFLGLIGVPVPVGVQGVDRSAALRANQPTSGDDVALLYNQFSSDEAQDQQMPEWRGLRTRTHTYVETAPGVAWLLFDDIADPYQMKNLAADDAFAPLRAELSGRLASLLRDANDPFVPGDELLSQLNLADAWRDRNERIYA